MQSLPPFPPSPQLPLGFRSLRTRAFLARVNSLSPVLPSLDVTDRRGTARSLVLATLGRLVEPKIFGLILYFGLPFRMQPINYKCDKCVNLLIYCDQEPLWLLTHRRSMIAIWGVHVRQLTRCKICFTLGLFAKYFSIKSFSFSLKSHMNVP